jgi:predicted PurR-regulated permease PerM
MSVFVQSNQQDEGWYTRERILTSLLAIVTLLLLYLCFEMLVPFLPALTFGLTLSVATQRPYRWLKSKITSRSWSAGIATLIVAIILVIPAASLIAYGLQQGIETIGSFNGDTGKLVRQSIQNNPWSNNLYHWLQKSFKVDEQLSALTGNIAQQATVIVASSFSILTQAVITLFVLFFLYRDGDRAIYVFAKLIPLSDSEATSLINRINDTILATVNGSFIVALVQSILACVMYYVLDIPGALIWGLATFFMALVPVFGTFVIWGPISIFLLISGFALKGAVLLAYGILAIGTIDNLLYPYLVGDRMRLHTVPTFFAALGGITVFGAAGLVLGPMIVAVTTALLDVWWRRTLNGKAAETAKVEKAGSDIRPAKLLGGQG